MWALRRLVKATEIADDQIKLERRAQFIGLVCDNCCDCDIVNSFSTNKQQQYELMFPDLCIKVQTQLRSETKLTANIVLISEDSDCI